MAAGAVLCLSVYRRTRGRPLWAATELLEAITSAVGEGNVKGISLTGGASKLAAAQLGAGTVNEFKAIAAGLAALGIEARTVFEMGGESSKYLRLAKDSGGAYGIVDYDRSGECAAGTGSFLDQQALRMQYSVEEVGAGRV